MADVDVVIRGSSAQQEWASRQCVRRSMRHRLLRTALVSIDTVALLVAALFATFVRFRGIYEQVSFEHTSLSVQYSQVSVIVTLLWLGFIAFERLYDLDRVFRGTEEFSCVVRALSFGVVGFILVTFVLKLPGLSRAWTLLAWAFSVVLVSAGRIGLRCWLKWMRRRGRLLRPTLIVGNNAEAADLIRILRADRSSGLVPVGVLASSRFDRLGLDFLDGTVPELGIARELPAIVDTEDVDTVVIASTAFDHDILARMVAELRGKAVDIHISSGLFDVLTSRVLVREISGVPLITIKGVSLSRRKMAVKRAFDLVLSGAVILLGLPVWLAITAAIKLDSPGPVFFAQQRVGRKGARFGMLKFRSMYVDAEQRLEALRTDNEASGPLFKMKDDPRVTRVGKWLRKFSLDEFPQLLNVLSGEMSLVGPRPPLPGETLEYSTHHWRRMEVLPGMTGLWQVSGRSNLTFEEMVRLDLYYIENWSVGLDLALIGRTVPAVLVAQGAY